MITPEDLVAIPTTALISAIAERLAAIELNELEEKILLPRPTADIGLYEKLQGLLNAARAWENEPENVDRDDAGFTPVDNQLLDAIDTLRGVRTASSQDDDDGPPHPGDIIALAQRHALLARRHAELQRLYKTRMDVTRDAIAKARKETAEIRAEIAQVRAEAGLANLVRASRTCPGYPEDPPTPSSD